MQSTTNYDSLGTGSVPEPIMQGSEARKLFRGSEDSRLPEDAWKELSDLMVQVGQHRLTLVDDLRNAGLVETVSLGTTISTWQETNEFTEAQTDMDGRSQGDEDSSIWVTRGVPVPIHHKDFRVGHREEAAEPDIPTNNAQKSMRQVMERIEDILANGWGQAVGDGRGDEFQIYGYTNHPDRATVSGSSWSTASNVEPDVREAIEAAEANNHYGPYVLYVGSDPWGDLRAPSPNFENMRLRQQIQELDEIQAVRVADQLGDSEAVLVQMTADVVDAVAAGDIVQQAEWEQSPFQTSVKVFSVFAPRIKSDNDGQSGIVHVSGI